MPHFNGYTKPASLSAEDYHLTASHYDLNFCLDAPDELSTSGGVSLVPLIVSAHFWILSGATLTVWRPALSPCSAPLRRALLEPTPLPIPPRFPLHDPLVIPHLPGELSPRPHAPPLRHLRPIPPPRLSHRARASRGNHWRPEDGRGCTIYGDRPRDCLSELPAEPCDDSRRWARPALVLR